MATNVFINEFHYDNAGTDVGEFVEIAGAAGADLTGWKVVLYNGNPTSGKVYATYSLNGALPNQQNGFGTVQLALPANGMQNGGSTGATEPDGIALVDASGAVVQFISYEGAFTAVDGPAAGMTSTNVGVYEDGTKNGTSIGLVGSGTKASDFTWALINDDTPGGVNVGQTFANATPVTPGTLSIADAAVTEGNSGTRDLVFTVTRDAGSTGAVSATWSIGFGTGANPANAADLASGTATTGTVTFADGQTKAEIRIPVAGDTSFEADETFTVTLSGATGGASIAKAAATGTIVNDDAAPPAGPANVFINEIHYDNSSTDVGEGIEIAGTAGTDLSGYKLVFYNGTNTPDAAPVYDTLTLSGVIDDEGNGFGALAFPRAGLQNGAADGVALIAPDGKVIQLLSYEGTFTAAAGTPAAGVTSTDIGVAEEPAPGAGFSLQLKGAGSSAGDFTWAPASADSFGSLNDGQTILSATGPGHLRIDDARVTEGNSGTTNMVFTVHRAGGSASAASVDYQVLLNGTADAADLAPGAVLSGTVTFAAGEYSKQIVVPVAGDTLSERNETLTVKLGATTGNVVVDVAQATGTIVNDDSVSLSIGEIQGAGHVSAYVGQTVVTTGIVTAVDSNGFYLQSAVGDGDSRTSDAIFVFTSTAPKVAVGDGVSVQGTVTEYAADAKSLSVTEITAPKVTVESSGNALPAAVLIGEHGVLPPSQAIDSDHLTNFDPAHDGIDFWESLEGMRVTIETPQVVSNTNNYGETDVVASLGHGATGVNDRGGITISAGDYNPEKIQLDDDSAIFAGYKPGYSIGDQLSSVTGIVNYAFSNYEVLVTDAVTVTKDVTIEREQTALQGDATHLSIASYNVENLDASDNKFDILAKDIVNNLRAPDIIALQEIQDADGAGTGADLSGTVTAKGLIDAIYAASGLHYAYIEIAPTTPNSTGGEPNGNIRSGYLYNLDRVSYVQGSAELIDGAAYNGSRKPLVAQFEFAGQKITTINVHFTSRGGSDPLWGNNQPAANAGDAARTAQAAGVKAYVNDHLAADPSLNIAVLGDWNGFYFEDAQTQLTDPAKGGVLTNLNSLMPAEERYSYMFEGNAQQIDNILVTAGLLNNAQIDSVHINAEFGGNRPSDHDPQVALLSFASAPTQLALSNAHVAENLPAGTVVGTLSATDTPGDTLTYTLIDDAGGRFAVDAKTGIVTTTVALDHEAVASLTIVAKVTDQTGLSTQAGFTVAVDNVNEAPGALTLNGTSVDENLPAGSVVGTLAATDPDGEALTYTLTDDAGGRFAVDAKTGIVTTTVALDHEAAASFTIAGKATDAGGLASEARFTVQVNDVNEAPTGLALSHASVDENLPAGTVVGKLSASDPDGDAIHYALADDAGGRFAVDAKTGIVTTTQPLDHEAAASYTIVGKAIDAHGLASEASFNVLVGDVNEAPVAEADGIKVDEDATTGNLWAALLGNDHDPDAGQTLTIVDIDTVGTLGSIAFDPTTQTLRYSADSDIFDVLAPGSKFVDHFTYTITDGHGMVSTAMVSVTVTAIADGVTRIGTIYADTITGTAGEDTLYGNAGNDTLYGMGGHDLIDGGLGNDTIYGGDGHDVLSGNNGDDTLYGDAGNDRIYGGAGNDKLFGGDGRDILLGGAGNDTLTGGAGADSFHFGRSEGSDTITDFNTAEDQIILDGISLTRSTVSDVNRDGIADLTLTFTGGTSVTLLGVHDVKAVTFGAPDGYTSNDPGFGGSLSGGVLSGLFESGPKLVDLSHGF